MPLVNTAVRLYGKRNDLLRRKTMPPGVRFFLLKRGKETKSFVVVSEILKGWLVTYNEFRGEGRIEHADVAGDFPDLLAQSSFLAYGQPIGDPAELDVYSLAPDRRDLVPPNVKDPFWKVYLTREGTERFEIPD